MMKTDFKKSPDSHRRQTVGSCIPEQPTLWRTWLLPSVVLIVFAHGIAGAQAPSASPDVEILPTPAPREKRVQLPPTRPTALRTSYLRRFDRAVKPASSTHELDNPPDPTALQQPAWLARAKPSPKDAEPLEPAGEAVVIGDTGDEEDLAVELASAQVEMAPARASAILEAARELAVAARTAGDLGDVIERCQQALVKNPGPETAGPLAQLTAWALNRRGELLVEAGDEHAAFDDFQEAILFDANCWQALHNRGVTLARYGKHSDALADFDRVAALAPDFVVVRQNRAEVYSQLQKWEAAIGDYSAAIEENPEESPLYVGRGHAWHQLSRTSKAVSDFNQAIILDATLGEAYAGRGNVFASEGMYEQAVADFEQALAREPVSGQTYMSVAWLLSTCPFDEYRSPERGLEAARRARKLLSDDTPALLDTLAAAHANAGEFRAAIRFEQQAIVLAEPQSRRTYENRLALYRRGQAYRAGDAE